MPTTTARTIGQTTGFYSSVNAWDDDAAANDLVASDLVWKGLMLREGGGTDGEWTQRFEIESHTTDATRFMWLTAEDGESFIDNMNWGVDPLKYDPATGVAIRFANFYTDGPAKVTTSYTRIDRLQIKGTGAAATLYSDNQGCVFAKNLLEASGSQHCVRLRDGSQLLNSLCIASGTQTFAVDCVATSAPNTVKYNAIVRPSGSASFGTGNAINSQGTGDDILRGNAVFGFSKFYSTTNTGTGSDYNQSDTTTNLPGANSNGTRAITDQFIGADGTDWTPKSTADLVDAGPTTDSDVTDDIRGTARPQGSAYDVGCYEQAAGGPPPAGAMFIPRRRTIPHLIGR